MPEDIDTRLATLEEKTDKMYASVEKTRKYILVMTIITVGAVIVPLIGLVIVIPMVLQTFSSAYAGLL